MRERNTEDDLRISAEDKFSAYLGAIGFIGAGLTFLVVLVN